MFRRLLVYMGITAVWYVSVGLVSTVSGNGGSWGQWTNVSICSSSCDEGRQTRTRNCNIPAEGRTDCIGPDTDTITCNNGLCPDINSSWSQWTNFSSCSATCGDGVMTRNRTCEKSSASETASCNGSYIETILCNEGDCAPLNGSWGQWSNYSECSVSCGNGTQYMTRECDNPAPQYGGLYCDGLYMESRPCNDFDCPGMDNKGKEFILGFMLNAKPTTLNIFITTEINENVNVTITTPLHNRGFKRSVVVRKGLVKKVNVSSSLMGNVGLIENKGIHIKAEKDIAVYAVNKVYASTDAYLALPMDVIGQEYYVIAWNARSSFMIIATHDATTVHVKCGFASRPISLIGKTCSPGVSVNFILDKFQTFFASYGWNAGDFTGTHIYADKPISVLAGSIYAKIGQGARDHLVQQMLPIEKWGKDFVTIGMPNCRSEDTYRIIASQDKTIVNISGYPSHMLFKAGDFYTFNIKDKVSKTITSNKGIALALYANGYCDNSSRGDPSMILIPPIQQFAADYTFSTVSLEHDDFVNSLSIVISDSYIAGLRFDGNTLPPTTWRAAEGREDIKYTSFQITSGAHSIYHIDSSVTFLAVSTGIQLYNSYGYPAGLKFPSTTKNCTEARSGKTGTDTCGFSLDPCKDNPCLNGGTCLARGWTNFECICPITFGGTTCKIDLCKPHPSDVVFVIDSSKSMGHHFFEMQKQFIKDLTRNWTIEEEHFQVAIVSFSSTAQIEYDFGSITDFADLKNKISMLQFLDKSSRIDVGIAAGEQLLRQQTRQVDYINVNKIMIVITDGLTSSPRDIKAVSSGDITTFVVALGEDVSHYYLKKIVGKMANVLPPKPESLLNVLLSKLIHPVCNICHTSNETDLIIMVDVSRDMEHDDITTHVPSVTNKLLSTMGVNFSNTRISLVTFDSDISIRFIFRKYTSTTKYRMQQDMSAFYQSDHKVENFTEILHRVNDLLFDIDSGGIESTKKIILIISNFRFKINDNTTEDIANELHNLTEVFTIGLDPGEESFSNMLRLTSSSFHVGTVGNMFANVIDTFINAFVEQISYVKCYL